MTPRETIVQALGSANVKAFLHVIRQGETDQTDRAYVQVNGQPDLTSLAQHPYYNIPTTRGARASGAYQFLGTTWAEVAERYPQDCADFSVYAQDFGAVVKINDRGALKDVLNADISAAIRKCRKEWTSLPGAAENSGRYTLEKAMAVYHQYGGGIAEEQSAAPIEDAYQSTREAPMGALLIPLVQTLIGAFAPLAQQKLSQALDKHGGDPTAAGAIVNGVMDAVAQATGTDAQTLRNDPKAAIAAVNAVQNDPVKIEQVQNASLDVLDKLAPVLDKLHQYSKEEWAAEEASRDAGSRRAKIDESVDQDRMITVSLVVMVLGILALLSAGMGALIYFDQPYGEFLSLFSGAVGVVLGKFGTRIDYRYGSSRSSSAKDTVIQQLSKK